MSFRSIVRDLRDSLGSFSRRSFEVRVSNGTPDRVETNHQDLVVIKNTRWANLPAELLRDVMKKLDESENRWPARKQVVACAGVCKTWRLMCKEIVKSPEFSGKLTFPVSLKQPGPRDGIIQCFIKRDKSNMTYHLYLSLSPALLVESGKFLLSAKRTRRTTYTEYVITMDADNISRSRSTYIGKLRSNFLGTKFIIYDTAPAYNGCKILSPPNRSRRFNSKKVSPKVPSGSYNIAQVTYELNMLGPRGPRRMHCIMHSIPFLALEPGGTVPGQLLGPRGPRRMHCIMHSIPFLALEPGGTVPGQPDILQRSLDESFRSISSSKIIDHPGDFSSARFSDIVRPQGEEESHLKEQPLMLRNKPPRWLEQLQCWCLNFRGRVTIASVKNFQLMSAATVQPASGGSVRGRPQGLTTRPSASTQQPGQSDHAFAICLSSFDAILSQPFKHLLFA